MTPPVGSEYSVTPVRPAMAARLPPLLIATLSPITPKRPGVEPGSVTFTMPARESVVATRCIPFGVKATSVASIAESTTAIHSSFQVRLTSHSRTDPSRPAVSKVQPSCGDSRLPSGLRWHSARNVTRSTSPT